MWDACHYWLVNRQVTDSEDSIQRDMQWYLSKQSKTPKGGPTLVVRHRSINPSQENGTQVN
jgi:hypothetical protein